MKKSVAIIQSNYIPWKGYFDLIRSVDEFILLDEVQFTRRDWRNRNIIKTAAGPKWLTIPVQVKGKYFQKISETEVSRIDWHKDHWNTIDHHLRRAPFFDLYEARLREAYMEAGELRFLSHINRKFIQLVSSWLGISTKLVDSREYAIATGKTERLVALCRQAGASEYVSGPAALGYLDEQLFASSGIRVRWFEYTGYREYPQLYGPFEHRVSVLDLIMHTGPDALHFLARIEPAGARSKWWD